MTHKPQQERLAVAHPQAVILGKTLNFRSVNSQRKSSKLRRRGRVLRLEPVPSIRLLVQTSTLEGNGYFPVVPFI